MFTSPTPRAVPAAVDFAVSMSAPLTWSGVQLGYLARSCAAAPATIGDANDVPDIHMKPEVVTRFQELGAERVGSTPEELAQLVTREIDVWSDVVRRSGVKAN